MKIIFNMKPNLETCPKCIGVGETMLGKSTGRGFKYKICDLCNGKKQIPKDLADDYLLSINEDNIDMYDEE